MNYSKLVVVSLSLIISSIYTLNLSANEHFEIHHQVTHVASDDIFHNVTLSLRISNFSDFNLTEGKIRPSGGEFSVTELNNSVDIGDIPAFSEVTISWTAKTPIAIEYFKSDMPIFFN